MSGLRFFIVVILGCALRAEIVSAEPSSEERIVQTLEDSIAGKKSTEIGAYGEVQIKAYLIGSRLGTSTFRKSNQDVGKGIYQEVYKIVKGRWLPPVPASDVWRHLKGDGELPGSELYGRQVIHMGEMLYELILQIVVEDLHLELLIRVKNLKFGRAEIYKRFRILVENAIHNQLSEHLKDLSNFKPVVNAPSKVASSKTEAIVLKNTEKNEAVAPKESDPEPVVREESSKMPSPIKEEVKQEVAMPTVKQEPVSRSEDEKPSEPQVTSEDKPTNIVVKPPVAPESNAVPIGTVKQVWDGTVKSSADKKDARFKLLVYQISEDSFTGEWQGGIVISNGKRRGNMLSWESNGLNDGCRDYKVRVDMTKAGDQASVIILAKDRCQKPAQFSSSGKIKRVQ